MNWDKTLMETVLENIFRSVTWKVSSKRLATDSFSMGDWIMNDLKVYFGTYLYFQKFSMNIFCFNNIKEIWSLGDEKNRM